VTDDGDGRDDGRKKKGPPEECSGPVAEEVGESLETTCCSLSCVCVCVCVCGSIGE
jgi:hypothetical protein